MVPAFGRRCIAPRMVAPPSNIARYSRSSRLAIRAHRRPRCCATISPRTARRYNRRHVPGPLRPFRAVGDRRGGRLRQSHPARHAGAVGHACSRDGPGHAVAFRRGHRQRPGRGRHRGAVVPRRHRHRRGSDRGGGQPGGGRGSHPHRCDRPGGGAGVHRPARPVRVQRAGRQPRRQQDHPGHHHRDHRRRRVDRAGQRSDARRSQGDLRLLQDHPGLAQPRRVLRAVRRGRRRRSTSALSSVRAGCATTSSARPTGRPPPTN